MALKKMTTSSWRTLFRGGECGVYVWNDLMVMLDSIRKSIFSNGYWEWVLRNGYWEMAIGEYIEEWVLGIVFASLR